VKKFLWWLLPLVAILLLGASCLIYAVNAKIHIPSEEQSLFIYPNTTNKEITSEIKSQNVEFNNMAFRICAALFKVKKFPCGHYTIKKGMKVSLLVDIISKGKQTPVKLIIGRARLKEDLAKTINKYTALSEEDLLIAMNNNAFLNSFGVDTLSLYSLFVPNTYEVYWNLSIEELFQRMNKEQKRFWEKRQQRLDSISLTKQDVITLASIIEEETNKNDEKPLIASVYINRLKKNMKLQADPTIKYALQDFTIRRIYNNMLQTPSPYNTYLNYGLPPSPICLPSIASIDAVLNYKNTPYIYFCAKDDFSGYHNFASSLQEHYKNARKYHKALNKLKEKK
jgi:UPF0755 protein